jgi:hypothetical protein
MSKQQTVTGFVTHVARQGHTLYGNPIMSVTINDNPADMSNADIYRISDNAGIVYGIENPEYKSEPHTFALTRAGRISHEVRA